MTRMAIWTVTVTINQDGLGVFAADVAPYSVGPVEDGDTIDWDITEPVGFPRDAEVFLQFFKLNGAGKKIPDTGCLKGGNNGKHKGKGNGHRKKVINGKVEAAPKSGMKTHSYLVAYTATMGGGILVDPEIVVDGGVKKKAAKTSAAQSSRRPVAPKKAKKAGKARKAAPVKKAKQRKPGKTAKRSTKRKAKKR